MMNTHWPLSQVWPGEPYENRLAMDGYMEQLVNQARSSWSHPTWVRSHWDLSEMANTMRLKAQTWVSGAELARWEDDGGRARE